MSYSVNANMRMVTDTEEDLEHFQDAVKSREKEYSALSEDEGLKEQIEDMHAKEAVFRRSVAGNCGFIELTHDNQLVLIHARSIIGMERWMEGTIIYTGSTSYEVKETPEMVLLKMAELYNPNNLPTVPIVKE